MFTGKSFNWRNVYRQLCLFISMAPYWESQNALLLQHFTKLLLHLRGASSSLAVNEYIYGSWDEGGVLGGNRTRACLKTVRRANPVDENIIKQERYVDAFEWLVQVNLIYK